jgi:hypothetical protein
MPMTPARNTPATTRLSKEAKSSGVMSGHNFCDKKWHSAEARRAFKTIYKPILQLSDQSVGALLLGTAFGKFDRLVYQLVNAPLKERAIETFWHNPFPNVLARR